MFGKKIMVRVDNKDKIAIATAWGIIEHRPFAKYRITEHFTTFWLTAKEKKALEDIVKTAESY